MALGEPVVPGAAPEAKATRLAGAPAFGAGGLVDLPLARGAGDFGGGSGRVHRLLLAPFA